MNKKLNKMMTVLLIIMTALLTSTIVQANEGTDESIRLLTVEYAEPVVYKGAIITRIMNDEITYAKKCENCGYHSDGLIFYTSEVNSIHTAFVCPTCKRRQEVSIVVKGFKRDLWVSEEVIIGPADEDIIENEFEDENELYKDKNARVVEW